MMFHVSDNAFPIGSIPDQVSVSSRDIAALFSALDATTAAVRSCGTEVSTAVIPKLTAVELLVERIAGL